MPGTVTTPDIELIIENVGGGGSGKPPEREYGGDDSDDGKDGGGGRGGNRRPGPPSPERYVTGISVAIIAILIFFMALASAFLLRRAMGKDWVPVHLPVVLWINTAVLLGSSLTIELARRRLGREDRPGFKAFWTMTTALGFLFLAGQLIAWKQLAAQGIYIASNPGSSFFYIFTGLHALHLLGGIAALLFVAFRHFEKASISRSIAAEVTSYYWHFMDALWLFLLALLYLGK